MRGILGLLSLLVAVGIGLYLYSAQMHTSATPGGAAATPVATVNATGVKSDLLSIASAERGYFASQGKYASLDELIAGNYITIQKARPPYTYDIEATDSGFRVTATRGGGDASVGPARISIDETMQISSE
ncbi:MAG: hypothetical protein JST79_21445 [Acidobacteria bacterium]|jgi:hypothetical protein|nr:hypothetical protein [Acidobacteriota bacterium]